MGDPGAQRGHERNDALIGELLAGRYQIESKLGKGGMAVVYRAQDQSFGRTVAIKVLRTDVASDPVAAKRLVREARAAGQLHHPNIITMHDVGETGGMVYIVMELMEGRELADLMEEQGAVGVRRALDIGRQVAGALTVAHSHGIIHRDIKPENLFLIKHDGSGDFIKMLDFSIAKLPTNMVTAALTRAGSVFGTPHYMAPEQVEGRVVCTQTDLYALGAVIYELIAGEPPFDGDSVIDILLQHAKKRAPRLCDLPSLTLPAGLSELVDSLLAKKESDRPATAADVESALLRMIATLDNASAPDADRTVALAALPTGGSVMPPALPQRQRPQSPRPAGPRTSESPRRAAKAPPRPAPSSRRPSAPRPAASRPAPAAEDCSPDLAALDLPSAPGRNRRQATSGGDDRTMLGHGMAAKVREAAERIERQAAEAAAAASARPEVSPAPPTAGPSPSEDEPTRLETPAMELEEPTRLETAAAVDDEALVPPPPAGRARVPGVMAPGAVAQSTSVRVRGPAPEEPPRPSADSIVTMPEVAAEDVAKLQRAAQATVAISPAQMQDLSRQIRGSAKQSSKLIWVAVPVAAIGVIAIVIAIYFLTTGS